MTLEELRLRAPRMAEAYEAELRLGGSAAAAQYLGRTQSTVSCQVTEARRYLDPSYPAKRLSTPKSERTSERQQLADLRDGSRVTRCKCGLALPCECLLSSYAVASSRSGEAAGDF